jgi:hypothetical protein
MSQAIDVGFFEIFAECSIAFAGFAAVHAALIGSTTPRGNFRAWTILLNGALSFALSIVPLLLALTPLDAEALWRVASLVGVVASSTASASLIRLDIRMSRQGHPPQLLWSIRLAQSLSIIATLTIFLNLVGWLWTPGAIGYAAGLALILSTGIIALLHTFMIPVQEALRKTDKESPDAPKD